MLVPTYPQRTTSHQTQAYFPAVFYAVRGKCRLFWRRKESFRFIEQTTCIVRFVFREHIRLSMVNALSNTM